MKALITFMVSVAAFAALTATLALGVMMPAAQAEPEIKGSWMYPMTAGEIAEMERADCIRAGDANCDAGK